jgi:hypothetical protein
MALRDTPEVANFTSRVARRLPLSLCGGESLSFGWLRWGKGWRPASHPRGAASHHQNPLFYFSFLSKTKK